MGTESEGIQDRRVQLRQGAIHALGQNGVVESLSPQGTVGQLCGEAGVALVQAVLGDALRQHQVRIGVIRRDSAQDLVGRQTGRVRGATTLTRCRGGVLPRSAGLPSIAGAALTVPAWTASSVGRPTLALLISGVMTVLL